MNLMVYVFIGVGGLLLAVTAVILIALWFEEFLRRGPAEPDRDAPAEVR